MWKGIARVIEIYLLKVEIVIKQYNTLLKTIYNAINHPEDFPGVEIYFLGQVDDPGPREEGYPHLKKLEDKWMVDMGSLGTLNPLKGCNKKDDAAAKAWGT